MSTYNNIYWAGFSSKSSVRGMLYIDKLNYVGVASKLILERDSIEVIYNTSNLSTDPILALQCQFSIVNNQSDFFTLLPLMIAEEREFKVRVIIYEGNSSYTIFDGFLNSEAVSQKYLKYQMIDLVASNYINKLDNTYSVSIDTLQNVTFINVLNEILKTTGSIFSIRVNTSIHAEGDVPASGQTLFNLNGFFTELFWEDQSKRKSSLFILTSILKTFNCYIYWWDNYWYIERYEDLFKTNKSYVEYSHSGLYSPSDAGQIVNVTESIETIEDTVFTEQSQSLSSVPGLSLIEIKLNDQRYLNLVKENLKSVVFVVASESDPLDIIPDFRVWNALLVTLNPWSDSGLPKNTILSSIHRTLEMWEDPLFAYNYYGGLFTKFKSTVKSLEDQISVAFKYCVNPDSLHIEGKALKDCKFVFHWYLRVLPDHDYIGENNNESAVYFDENPAHWLQTTQVSGENFDETTNVVTVRFNIPIGSAKDYRVTHNTGYLRGDYDLILDIGWEQLSVTEDGAEVNKPQPREVWIGDIEVTSNGDDQDNFISGKANTKYLDKLSIDLDLYDAEILDYANAILRGTELSTRTEKWGTTGGSSAIVTKGVCYSNTHNPPTLSDSFTIDGTGFGEYQSQLSNLQPNTLYYYRAYATNALGVTQYGDTRTLTTEQLAVGHKYQGGIIGYIFTPDDPPYVLGEVHGLIVSLTDIDTSVLWGKLSGGGPYTCDAAHYNIGEGKSNTEKIEANTFQNDYVIRKIVDYVNEGYEDWFLPSIGELMALHPNRQILGFGNDWYWSSSEKTGAWKKAWAVDFSKASVNRDYWDKHNYMRSKACRYF